MTATIRTGAAPSAHPLDSAQIALEQPPGSPGLRRHRRQAVFYALTLALLVAANFWLPRAVPGDPLASMQDPAAHSYIASADVRARVSAYYGLDQPLPRQFLNYLGGLAHGDLGWSIEFNTPVATMLTRRLPWTLLLVLTATAISGLIGLLTGVESAWRRGSRLDSAAVGAFIAVRNVPVYLLATFMLVLLSIKLELFPLGGAVQPFADLPPLQHLADVAWHLALPVATLTIEMVGGSYLLARNSMVGVLGADYMASARAAGLPDPVRKYRYAMRNAILPFFTTLALQVAMAVTGAIFIETVFAYPGVGQLMFEAVRFRDYPILQGGFLVFGIWVLAANALADAGLRLLDPRLATHA